MGASVLFVPEHAHEALPGGAFFFASHALRRGQEHELVTFSRAVKGSAPQLPRGRHRAPRQGDASLTRARQERLRAEIAGGGAGAQFGREQSLGGRIPPAQHGAIVKRQHGHVDALDQPLEQGRCLLRPPAFHLQVPGKLVDLPEQIRYRPTDDVLASTMGVITVSHGIQHIGGRA